MWAEMVEVVRCLVLMDPLENRIVDCSLALGAAVVVEVAHLEVAHSDPEIQMAAEQSLEEELVLEGVVTRAGGEDEQSAAVEI